MWIFWKWEFETVNFGKIKNFKMWFVDKMRIFFAPIWSTYFIQNWCYLNNNHFSIWQTRTTVCHQDRGNLPHQIWAQGRKAMHGHDQAGVSHHQWSPMWTSLWQAMPGLSRASQKEFLRQRTRDQMSRSGRHQSGDRVWHQIWGSLPDCAAPRMRFGHRHQVHLSSQKRMYHGPREKVWDRFEDGLRQTMQIREWEKLQDGHRHQIWDAVQGKLRRHHWGEMRDSIRKPMRDHHGEWLLGWWRRNCFWWQRSRDWLERNTR